MSCVGENQERKIIPVKCGLIRSGIGSPFRRSKQLGGDDKVKTPNTSRKRYRLGLATQLIILVVIVTLIVGGTIGIVLTNTSANSLKQETLRYDLAQADLAAQFASSYVQTFEAGARSFAARPTVVQAILSDTPEKLQVELSQFVQSQAGLDGGSIYDAQGIQKVSNIVNATTIGQSFADREWFQQMVAIHQPYQGVPIKSRVTGKPIAPYAIPILDDQGQLRGVVGAGISLGTLCDAIVNIGYGTDTRASIIDTRNGGIILGHSDPQRVLTPVSGKNEAVTRLMAGERGTIETLSSSGEMDLIGFTVVPDLPWGIMVTTPSSVALAPLDSLRLKSTLIILISVLLVGFLGGWWMVRVTKPLIRLRDASRKLAAGELTHRVHFTQRNEIGELGQAFDQMAALLSEKEGQLHQHAEQLEQKVQERTVQLERKTTELEQANIRLQEVDRLKSVFLASMSHELRTPLNSIIGFTGIILQGMPGEINQEQRKQLTMVKNSANHLLSLINDVLDVSRIEAGRIELSPEEMRLDDVVKEVADAFSPLASEKGLELLTEVPQDISLLSDKRRVKQVLMNLVSNAIKFTDRGSVKIAARVARDGNAEIRVIDTGIGIEKEDTDKLFQPFQQIGESLTKSKEGTGLGLYLTKRLATLLGGYVTAKSEYGRGSEFIFTILLKYKGETGK